MAQLMCKICSGRKVVRAPGMMTKKCMTCKGIGYIGIPDEAQPTIIKRRKRRKVEIPLVEEDVQNIVDPYS